MRYTPPIDDLQFQLEKIHNFNILTTYFPDFDAEILPEILETIGKFASEELFALRGEMEKTPPQLMGNEVIVSNKFGEIIKALSEMGVMGVCAPEEFGGLGLPLTVQIAMNELIAAANPALQLCPLLTQGQIEALNQHGSDAQKSHIIPKLISGEWTGTMLLTEAQAGSDLSAIKTKAVLQDDGSYALFGQKIFITWGDHNQAENISQLTLARIDGAADGIKGISLFFMPKYLDEGARNPVFPIALEEKLGLHGSPTCVMSLEGAKAWLIGKEGEGLKAMFTMMNNARLNVGVQGVGAAELAFQNALDYANIRKQGQSEPHGTILDYPDIRRMLIEISTKITIARALTLDCAIALDCGRFDKTMQARAEILTPIVKTYASEIALECANDAIQIFGGMGYIEETGMAQILRDARIFPIYEGTNGIQALDLVGRKLTIHQDTLLDMIHNLHAPNPAIDALLQATNALSERSMAERGADAGAYLRAFAEILGAHYLQKGSEHSQDYKTLYEDFQFTTLPHSIQSLNRIAQSPRNLPEGSFFS